MPWEVVPRSGGKAGCQPQSATQDCGNSGVRKQEDATAQTPPELVRSITWDQGTEMEKAPFHALAPPRDQRVHDLPGTVRGSTQRTPGWSRTTSPRYDERSRSSAALRAEGPDSPGLAH